MKKQILITIAATLLIFVIGIFLVYKQKNEGMNNNTVNNGAQNETITPTIVQENDTATPETNTDTGNNELTSDSEPINNDKKETMDKTKTLSKPELTIDQAKKYEAKITTNHGEMTVELHADKTPITVNNFIYLARNNYYNDTIFHRIIKGFMIQGGDPTGTGTGNPGYKFDDEAFDGEYKKGTIAMANSGSNTNGGQFFIMHEDYALPKQYVIFGQVTGGLEIVDKLASVEVQMNSSGTEKSSPVEPVKLISVEITEK